MRAMLLGGAGFIGLHLARRLVVDGHEVTIVDDFSRGRDDVEVAAVRAHPAVTVIAGDLTAPETGHVRAELGLEYDLLVVSVADFEKDDPLFKVGTAAFDSGDSAQQAAALEPLAQRDVPVGDHRQADAAPPQVLKRRLHVRDRRSG